MPGAAGYFEVEIEGVKRCHSKHNGEGFVDTQAKMDKIFQCIGQELNKKDENKIPSK